MDPVFVASMCQRKYKFIEFYEYIFDIQKQHPNLVSYVLFIFFIQWNIVLICRNVESHVRNQPSVTVGWIQITRQPIISN